jgi:serine phosphatase RsbU (regulator of sigma subunit)
VWRASEAARRTPKDATPKEQTVKRDHKGQSADRGPGDTSLNQSGPGLRPTLLTVLVMVVGLLITGSLALLAATVNDRNENRLLLVQVHEAGTVLAGAVPTIETPLASGAAIASMSNGHVDQFDKFMATYVGTGRPFVYAALCQLSASAPTAISSVGARATTTVDPSAQCHYLAAQHRGPPLSVMIVAGGSRLGYSYRTIGTNPQLGIYAEGVLPPHKHVSLPRGSSFSNLSFALYLGNSQRSSTLLETSAAHLPFAGRHAAVTVPFANTAITIVGAPTEPLGGALSRDLTTIVSILGVLLTIGAAALTERLVRRRRVAETLAAENRRLYAEQQSLAATMQRALLPRELPTMGGIEFGTRYVAGHDTMEIGGDWFDVIPRGANEFLFVVGDVSGRGVRAAIVMASLHYAIKAYAAEGDGPSTILSKLGKLLDVNKDGHFATVLCGSVTIDSHRLTLASAGHFSPLVVSRGKGSFVELAVGPPIGTGEAESYASTVSEIPPGGTLLAFTDGLIERRGEVIDEGLERLREASTEVRGSLDELLTEVVRRATPQGSVDDTAILGLRWLN